MNKVTLCLYFNFEINSTQNFSFTNLQHQIKNNQKLQFGCCRSKKLKLP